MKKEMLINVMQPEECRIAIIEDGILEELYVERTSQESYVGNIYKGRIVNIEPSIQAAFVDFGIGRNGFLHVSDVEPTYYKHLETRRGDEGGRRRHDRHDRRDRPRRGRDEAPRDRQGHRRHDEGPAELGPPPIEILPPEEEEIGTRSDIQEPVPHQPPEAATETPPPERESPPEERQAPPAGEKPRFMDSAERRTEKDAPRSGPVEPTSSVADADIFFPKPETAPAVTAPSETPAATTTDADEEPEPPLPTQAERVTGEFDDATAAEEPASTRDEIGEEQPEAPAAKGEAEEPDAEELEADEAVSDIMDELEELDERRMPRYDEDEGPPRRRRDSGRRRRHGSGRPGAGRPKPLIQDIFKRGQEVIVQVIKEGIGTKGPTLSTYISIAGRYLVLMPGLNRVGVSRKIQDDESRRRLREIFHELQPPKGLGFIIRTAGMDRTKKELQRDLAYLARLYQVIARRIKKLKAPAEIYQESDMITRTIRDIFTSDIDTIWVDEPGAFEHAQEFLQIVMPRYASRIKLFTDPEPIFHKHGIEEEIARIQRRHVPLPNGGSIVIDQTEALVAIDVNSGNFRADNSAEETAYQMNLQAAKEIARQLRLRDLGGVIVNDFIDMREEKHRRNVEKALRDAVRRDRARTKILKISQFGLIEMTRQRIRPSLKRSVYQECPHCRSTGQVKTTESMSIDVMRMIQLAAHRANIARVQIRVAEDVAGYLLNKKRKEITRLEEAGGIQVTISALPGASPEALDFLCYDNNNNEIKFLAVEETRPRRR
jgi:ribonuclease E